MHFIEYVLHRVAGNMHKKRKPKLSQSEWVREPKETLGARECLKVQKDSAQSEQRQKLELGERL